MTPRAAFGVTPLKGERHQRPGKAGSALALDLALPLSILVGFRSMLL